MKPKISVIIPTFNRADLLPDAIVSAARQVNIATEVIVVDDGSTDATQEIVKQLDIEVKYFYQEHRGTAAARNFGLQQASGEYVIFLDSDDVLMPNKNLQVNQIRLNPDIAVVYSRWKTTTLTGVELRKPGKDVTDDPLSYLLCHNIAAIHACLFRTNSLHQIGGFDETFTILEDWDLLIGRIERLGGRDEKS